MNQASVHRLMATKGGKKSPKEPFDFRLAANLGLIQRLFYQLYPQETSSLHFEKLLLLLPKLFDSRPEELKTQDLNRLESGNWYQSEQMVGMQLYVEHFNKNLKGLQSKLPYLKDLGINFLHLMPITDRPKGENDGGYAVNKYYGVAKQYGSSKDLLNLTKELRKQDMFLMLDFVVNHTSNEYPWAKKAKAGNKKYQNYYYTYADDTVPKAFEKSLPEVFPETSPGNFTFDPEMKKWVMTVFNSYQWDLNYSNPEVFLEMLSNLVKMINQGVDVVRFDALAFLWKKMGTISQNLPEAHLLISLFKMCLQTIAPGVIFLAEAIVAPTEIVKYFGEGAREGNECEIAYNASLMALLWNSVATKKTLLLYKSLTNVPNKPKDCTWINYIRCHDDIGLGYENIFIEEVGWNPQMHRKFLLDFYCQRLDWSTSTGLLFMYNPKTGDGRITGSAASLLGLEMGLEKNNPHLIHEAISKIVLLHGIILSYGGIPLIYAGDEIGTLNDYSFLKESNKKDDSRWVNRPKQNWDVISNLKHQKQDILTLHYTGNDHVFAFERTADSDSLMVLANFDEKEQVVQSRWISKLGYFTKGEPKNLVSDTKMTLKSGLLKLEPFQLVWLLRG